MEGLAAFGVACNVIQVVDFGCKVASLCKQIYDGAATKENQDLEQYVKTLHERTKKMLESLNELPQPLNETDTRLKTVARKCNEITSELDAELEKLKSKKLKSKRSTLLALVKVARPNKLDELQNRLSNCQKTLEMLNEDKRTCQNANEITISESFGQLDSNLQHFIGQVAAGQTKLRDLIRDELDYTRAYITADGDDTRKKITTLSSQLQDVKLQESREAQRDRLLGSLKYPEMNDWRNKVTESHEDTFEWIFEDASSQKWDSFLDWLKTGEGIYWISGKAGSGKSTLMKFIREDGRTRESLQEWKPGNEPLILDFFFWLAGSEIQRSEKGFLCSILYQLLGNEKSSMDLLPETIQKQSLSDWSTKELLFSIQNIFKTTPRPICLFLDGLDEFDPKKGLHIIVKLVRTLQELENVKLCVSSRPEPTLKRAFSTCSKLRLQDLTETDIWKYVNDQLMSEVGVDNFDEIDTGKMNDLILMVLEKADGVFLWVYLAIKSILQGLPSGDNLDELTKRVERLPSDMTDLYHDMLKRLNDDADSYLPEAAQYFRLMLQEEKYDDLELRAKYSVFEMMVATNPSIQEAFLEEDGRITEAEMLDKCKTTRTRLLARCAGLLEVDETKSMQTAEDFHWSKIRFIHRSAHDFLLETPGGLEILGHYTPTWLELRSTEIRTDLVCFLNGFQEYDFLWVKHILFLFSRRYSNTAIEEYMDPLILIQRICRRHKWTFTNPSSLLYSQDFIGTLAHYGCFPLVRHFVLDLKTCNICTPRFLDYILLCASRLLDSYFPLNVRVDLVEWILKEGADPRPERYVSLTGHSGISPLTEFLVTILNSDPEEDRDWLQLSQVIGTLISRGEMPDKPVILQFHNLAGHFFFFLANFDLHPPEDGAHLRVLLTIPSLINLGLIKSGGRGNENPPIGHEAYPRNRNVALVSSGGINVWYHPEQKQGDLLLDLLEKGLEAEGKKDKAEATRVREEMVSKITEICERGKAKGEVGLKDARVGYEEFYRPKEFKPKRLKIYGVDEEEEKEDDREDQHQLQ